MDFKMSLSLFLLISSWVSLGISQNPFLDAVSGGGGDNSSLPCVQKLMPCQPYLQSPGSPPASCCLPLKEMLAGDTACLCGIFNNIALLKSFNLTQDEALKLPRACGANADISICKNGSAAPSGSPVTPTPAAPSNSSSSSNTTTPKSAASTPKIAYFGGGFSFILFIANLLV